MKRPMATERLSKIYIARCGYIWLDESKWPQEWPISPITIIYLKIPSEKMQSFCLSLGQTTIHFSRFLLTFVLQKSSDVLCCGQTVRNFTIQSIRLNRRFFPFATTASKTTQKSADFHDKMECDRRKQLYLKIYQSVSVYFMKVNEKRRLERATLRMFVRKLILKIQVGYNENKPRHKALTARNLRRLYLQKR